MWSYRFDASVGSDYGCKWAWFQPVVGGYSSFGWRVCSHGFDASGGSDYGGRWAWFQPIVGGFSGFRWRLEELQCVATGLML